MATELTSNAHTDSRGGNLVASGYMLLSVLVYSFIPLVIARSSAVESPFLFNAGWRLGLGVGCLLTLLVFYRRILFHGETLSLVARSTFSWAIFLATLQSFENALFAWSIRFIDIAVANIIFETWPIVFILLIAWLLREGGGYRRNIRAILPLLALALVGLIFVVLSQAGGVNLDRVSGVDLGRGVGLAALAAVAASFGAFHLEWGRDLAAKLRNSTTPGVGTASLVLFSTILSYAISSLFGVVPNMMIGFSLGETIVIPVMATGIIGGLLLHAPGGMLFRLANLTTDNLGVNSLNYCIPVLSLIWLAIFSEINVFHADYLIIGTAAIITANLLINFEAEVRWGFKALLLALGTCGAIVYLRDGVFEFLGIAGWKWAGGGYFESITLSATVFTLLLVFRVTRLVGRTSEEDIRTFTIYRKLDMLARRGIIDRKACGYIQDMDNAKNNSAAEKEAYTQARSLIAEVDPGPLNEADSQLLTDAEANLDALARSKQVDIHLGEMFALGIFAGATIGLALLSLPPKVEGWTRLLVDLFAMVISAVVIFLMVHIQDLQRERDDGKFDPSTRGAEHRHHLVKFFDTAQRSFDQWLSIIVGAAIVITYAGLLTHKWLGWFGG